MQNSHPKYIVIEVVEYTMDDRIFTEKNIKQ